MGGLPGSLDGIRAVRDSPLVRHVCMYVCIDGDQPAQDAGYIRKHTRVAKTLHFLALVLVIRTRYYLPKDLLREGEKEQPDEENEQTNKTARVIRRPGLQPQPAMSRKRGIFPTRTPPPLNFRPHTRMILHAIISSGYMLSSVTFDRNNLLQATDR